MKKKLLQGIIFIFALIMFGRFAVPGAIFGVQYVFDGNVTPHLDSEFRFLSLTMVLWGALYLWAIPRIDQVQELFSLLMLVTFLGGLGRVASFFLLGAPEPPAIVATIIELVLPVIAVPWQRSLQRDRERNHLQTA